MYWEREPEIRCGGVRERDGGFGLSTREVELPFTELGMHRARGNCPRGLQHGASRPESHAQEELEGDWVPVGEGRGAVRAYSRGSVFWQREQSV